MKDPVATGDIGSCDLGVLNPGSVNSCSYRIAAGTNNTTGLQVYVVVDDTLNNAGDTADVDNVPGGGNVIAGNEEHGVRVTLGTGWTIGGSFSETTEEPVVAVESEIFSVNAAISDSLEANWTTVTHYASVNSSTPADSYVQVVTYRAWADT